MAVLIDSDAPLYFGGWVGATSGGTYVAVFQNTTGIVAYTDIFGTPTLIGAAQTSTIVHGASVTMYRIDAYMDSANVIHVASIATTNQTRDIAYNTISDPDGSPAWGTWEEAGPHDQVPLAIASISIVVDSNDAPHIIYCRRSKDMGQPYEQIAYVEKTGASWTAPVEITAIANNDYNQARLTIEASDELQAVYKNDTNNNVYYNSTSGGTWGTESSYALSNPWMGYPAIIVTTGGTVYRIHGRSSGDIYENSVDTTYNHTLLGSTPVVSAVLVNDTDRYVFYIDAINRDVYLIVNSGSGWVDKGVLVTGTLDGVIASWQYLNNNLVDEIIYLYVNSLDDVYVESYPLALPRRIFITHV